MKRFILFLSFVTLPAFAKMEVLFHPTDPTLEKIATWINEAHHTIDIAMYNMETSKSSPVMAAFYQPAVQEKLKNGELKVRVLFQGYGTPAENAKKMSDLEEAGLDVREIASGKDVHHKLALIDSATETPRVITGSANWSMASYKNYDENILFFDDEADVTAQFSVEFERLWFHSKEFGNEVDHPEQNVRSPSRSREEITAFFNSPRFFDKSSRPENFLSKQIAEAIDNAQSEILIASTRVRLTNVLQSLRNAAARGVKIKVLVSQDDYADLHKRADPLLNNPNVETRIKFYSLRTSDYLVFQMHNKWIVVDQKTILSGSFNWSDSSETNYIENLLRFEGARAQELLPSFLSRFDMLWERGRTGLSAYKAQLLKTRDAGTVPRCGFSPIALTDLEVKELQSIAPKCK